MKSFNCVFPGLYNYILAKDVGMIPFMLSGKYSSSITTYDNDNYTYLDTLFENKIRLNFLKKTDNEKRDVTGYIRQNAGNIDVIQFYHLRYTRLIAYIYTYKHYNRNGKIYIKLDANNDIIDFLIKRRGIRAELRRQLVKVMFKHVDLISIETKRNYKALLSKNIIDKEKLIYLPNGVIQNNTPLNNKTKTILYVGSIRKKNKSADMLTEAFLNIEDKTWKLELIGETDETMKKYFDKLFRKNPQLKNRIKLPGYMEDKNKLSQHYAESSIYCCCSQKESFGISTLEAAHHANYIISTDVGGSEDIIKTTGYGKIIKHNTKELTDTLNKTIKNWNKIRKNPEKIEKKVYENFGWEKLAQKIEEKL